MTVQGLASGAERVHGGAGVGELRHAEALSLAWALLSMAGSLGAMVLYLISGDEARLPLAGLLTLGAGGFAAAFVLIQAGAPSLGMCLAVYTVLCVLAPVMAVFQDAWLGLLVIFPAAAALPLLNLGGWHLLLSVTLAGGAAAAALVGLWAFDLPRQQPRLGGLYFVAGAAALMLGIVLAVYTGFVTRSGRRLELLRQARDELAAGSARLESILQSIGDGVLSMDGEGRLVFMNRAAERLVGRMPASAVGRRAADVLGLERDAFQAFLSGRLDPAATPTEPLVRRFQHGQQVAEVSLDALPLRDRDGRRQGALILLRDISQQRAAEEARHRAAHDALTGLANRDAMARALQTAIETVQLREESCALLYVDIDGFKAVNDTRGHHAGDVLLINIAQRLREAVRDGDTVARLGGDEFAVLMEAPCTEAMSADQARHLVGFLSKPYRLVLPEQEAPLDIRVGASIGLARAPDHARTAERLMRAADRAMYAAKRAGKNTFRTATEHMAQTGRHDHDGDG